MRTEIKHTCGCGRVFLIDSKSALVSVTILQVTIKNHSKDCDGSN
jgi:hypothetical protein